MRGPTSRQPQMTPFVPNQNLTPTGRADKRLLLLFSLVVVAYCVWVLTLPVFPSQDGPLHMYYAHVFSHFLAGSPGVYAKWYRHGSWLPPYSLYYYILAGFGALFGYPVADKIAVCCAMLLLGFGLRFLGRSMGLGGEAAAFLGLPVLLNWPLMMGFISFSLSLGLLLWAGGLWVRFGDGASPRVRLPFVALLYVILLAHPVPLLLLVIFCGLDLAFRVAARVRLGETSVRITTNALLYDALCLLAALPAFFYLHRFTVANVLQQSTHPSWHRRLSDGLFNYLSGAGWLLFQSGGPLLAIYRNGLRVLFFAGLAIGASYAWKSWRGRSWNMAAGWALLGLGFALLLPIVPQDLNGAHLFAWRLATVVFLLAALGTAGTLGANVSLRRIFVGGSVALSVFILAVAGTHFRAIALDIASVQTAPAHAPGTLGELVIQADRRNNDQVLRFRPYLWSGVHYFRQTGAILFNSSWLDESIIAVKRNDDAGVLLEPTFSDAPAQLDSSQRFAPGSPWNSPGIQFYLVERNGPDGPEQKLHPVPWAKLTAPLRAAGADDCDTRLWFCLLTPGKP